MALNQNQFAQTPVVGYLDLQTGNNNVWSCVHIKATPLSDADLVAGQTVKSVDVASDVPAVRASAITEVAFGVVVKNLKDQKVEDNALLEVARTGTVVYLEASAAISVGADVQYSPTTHKIATKASTNAILGQAIDKALNDGDIIRVLVNPRSGA